ncbi:Gdp-bound Rab23 Gtpase crystallized in P2(1)2(1)2(1) space group, partial [Cladochytrium replicatum]
MSNAKPPVANTPATVLIPEDLDIAIKILVVGNGSVGKSSMIHRYCKGGYNDAYVKTIGVDYLEKEVKVPGVDSSVRLMLWDTAGQEEFDSITREYYYEANAVALVFSTTDRSSFETIRSWRSKVQSVCRDIPMVLVQNKVDLIHKTVVTNQDGEALARDLHVKFYRVSVKDNVNLEEVFQYLAELYVKRMKEQHQA